MTFLDHGVQGGMLFAIPAMLARAREGVLWIAVSLGVLWGMTPDVAGFVAAIADPIDARVTYWNIVIADVPVRNDVYAAFHHDPVLQRVFFLHTLVDQPFHAAGGNWWPREWHRAVLNWSIELVGIAGIIFYIKQKRKGEV